MRSLSFAVLLGMSLAASAAGPFETHGRLRVSASKTHLEHADGTPFFFLADTCWTGPALSTEPEWAAYLSNRKAKGFTAVQFNIACPWSAAPADCYGHTTYSIVNGKLVPNEAFFKQLDVRMKQIADAGLLAVPVLCWAHKKGDPGKELTEEQILTLVTFEVERYKSANVLWVLAGDNGYKEPDAEMWKRIGRAVFTNTDAPVTTHPTGMNFPWADWADEKWLTVLGYQSGHGDSDGTWKWLHGGPPAKYGSQAAFTRPVINLEPPYEAHNGYASKKPHTDFNVRRATYWSLLVHPPAGVTYGGHGVWSWHLKPGEHPTGHQGTGPAKLWKDSLDLPGAFQMGHARKLFESVSWTRLRPNAKLLSAQPGDSEPGKFVAAAEIDDATVVVYAPAGGTVPLVPQISKRIVDVKWFDPRTGEFRKGDETYVAPDANDWVLVVKR